MRKILLLLVLSLFIGCSDSGFNNKNPYLPNYSFSFDINTNLPSYSNLQFAGNYIKIYPSTGPSRGVIVFNTGSAFNAFDGGCPNQDLSACSTLSVSGINAICPCDDASYSLYTGQAAGKEYPLKAYRVEVNGDNIRVYN